MAWRARQMRLRCVEVKSRGHVQGPRPLQARPGPGPEGLGSLSLVLTLSRRTRSLSLSASTAVRLAQVETFRVVGPRDVVTWCHFSKNVSPCSRRRPYKGSLCCTILTQRS